MAKAEGNRFTVITMDTRMYHLRYKAMGMWYSVAVDIFSGAKSTPRETNPLNLDGWEESNGSSFYNILLMREKVAQTFWRAT